MLHVAIDTAREYTYRADFPASGTLGARNLWAREEAVAWFMQIPERQRLEAAPAPIALPARRTYA